jgi:hypothetical protein
MLLGHAVGTPLSNKWATNPLNSLGDIATSYKKDMSNLNKGVVNNTD